MCRDLFFELLWHDSVKMCKLFQWWHFTSKLTLTDPPHIEFSKGLPFLIRWVGFVTGWNEQIKVKNKIKRNWVNQSIESSSFIGWGWLIDLNFQIIKIAQVFYHFRIYFLQPRRCKFLRKQPLLSQNFIFLSLPFQ